MARYIRDALPYGLIKAAHVNSAPMSCTFRAIVLPTVLPAAAVLGLLSLVGSWTNFAWPVFVLGTRNPTLLLVLQLLQPLCVNDLFLILVGVLVDTIPLLVLFATIGCHPFTGDMRGASDG